MSVVNESEIMLLSEDFLETTPGIFWLLREEEKNVVNTDAEV